MSTTSISSLTQFLQQGVKVSVGSEVAEIGGADLFIKSRSPATCKGKECSSTRECVGLAVWLTKTDPTTDTEPKGRGGWRAGSFKVCVSHLSNTDGKFLTDERTEPTVEQASEQIVSPEDNGIVTWELLAEVAQAALAGARKSGLEAVTRLALLSRKLKKQTELQNAEIIKSQLALIKRQEELLSLHNTAMAELASELEPAPLKESEAEEEKPVMGFSPQPKPAAPAEPETPVAPTE